MAHENMPAKTPHCAERIFSNARWDVSGHGCTRTATLHVDGKDWCGQHDPRKRAEKAEREREASKLGVAMVTARGIKDDARRAVTQQALAIDGVSQDGVDAFMAELQACVGRYRAAERAYNNAKAAADANGKVARFYYGR